MTLYVLGEYQKDKREKERRRENRWRWLWQEMEGWENIRESSSPLWDIRNIKRWQKMACGKDRMRASESSWREMENNRACPLRHSKSLNATACTCHCTSSPVWMCACERVHVYHAFNLTKHSTFEYVYEIEGRSPTGIMPAQRRWAHVTGLQRGADSVLVGLGDIFQSAIISFLSLRH